MPEQPVRPKGGIEQARRNLMRDDPELYAYIEARVAARELDRAGDTAAGAYGGHHAANRLWALSGQWEAKWRGMLQEEAESPPEPEPVRLAECVPGCDFLTTRQHAPGCVS